MSPRTHDIPLTRRDVVQALSDELDAAGLDGRRFAELARLMSALLHHELHERLEHMKALYEPLDPDQLDVVVSQPVDTGALGEAIAAVLEQGNYRCLEREEIDRAFTESSIFPIEVSVDFDVFEELVVYVRGETVRPAEVKRWFGLKTETVEVPTYERVCLYLRFKPEGDMAARERRALSYQPGMAVLKLFRHIPKADLEMLFPNTELRMRLLDKLLIGVPALVGGVPVLAKLAPALLALAILLGIERGEPFNYASIAAGMSGLAGLGMFLFRQWDKFKSRKVLFMKMLSDNLYFRNLDNNAGVLTRLIDEAEEEEAKEALLAYAFLALQQGQTEGELDERVEAWFAERFDVEVDFEVDDALGKLARLELCTEAEGRYRVVSCNEALARLDRRWDGLFSYGNEGGATP